MALARLRGRMPLIVFLLLALVCLALLGVACACLTDQPMQALERVLAAIPASPAIVEVWSFAALALLVAAALFASGRLRPPGRASPALLQRFLF